MKNTTNLLSVTFALALFTSFTCNAQNILGSWQLVKQTSCLEEEMPAENDTLQPLFETMKSMSAPPRQVVRFKEKGAGEESTRILNKKKSANNEKFAYKFNGETLLILDKKSQTIIDTYLVEKLTQDSLILSNASRACETKIFLKIKAAKSN